MIFNEKYRSFFYLDLRTDGINREEKDGYILLHKNYVKYICVCVYIYIYREREREREAKGKRSDGGSNYHKSDQWTQIGDRGQK